MTKFCAKDVKINLLSHGKSNRVAQLMYTLKYNNKEAYNLSTLVSYDDIFIFYKKQKNF